MKFWDPLREPSQSEFLLSQPQTGFIGPIFHILWRPSCRVFLTSFLLSFPLTVSSLWHNLAWLSAVSPDSGGDTVSATAAGRRFCYESSLRPGIRWVGGGEEGTCCVLSSLPFWLTSRPAPRPSFQGWVFPWLLEQCKGTGWEYNQTWGWLQAGQLQASPLHVLSLSFPIC